MVSGEQMNRKHVFIPHPIADKCTLLEALYWVAFNFYPLWQYSENCNDVREDIKCCDSVELESPRELNEFFSKEICKKYGLPENAICEYLKENNDYPLFSISKERIDNIIETQNLSEEHIQLLLSNRQKQDEFDKVQKVFDDALDDFLEEHKAALFLALKTGNVKASGHNLIKAAHFLKIDISDNIDIHDIWANDDSDGIEFEEVPSKEWYINSINWQASYLVNSNKTAFCHILVDVKSLFHSFPEREQQTKSVISINGVFLDNSPILSNNPKAGRPSYNWHSFHEEMAYRLLKGKLPKLQKTCVIEMGEWCLDEWKILPSETNLKNNISPFYAALKKSETI